LSHRHQSSSALPAADPGGLLDSWLVKFKWQKHGQSLACSYKSLKQWGLVSPGLIKVFFFSILNTLSRVWTSTFARVASSKEFLLAKAENNSPYSGSGEENQREE
jgi:hypothetical protein